jgi:hypothetical protein
MLINEKNICYSCDKYMKVKCCICKTKICRECPIELPTWILYNIINNKCDKCHKYICYSCIEICKECAHSGNFHGGYCSKCKSYNTYECSNIDDHIWTYCNDVKKIKSCRICKD